MVKEQISEPDARSSTGRISLPNFLTGSSGAWGAEARHSKTVRRGDDPINGFYHPAFGHKAAGFIDREPRSSWKHQKRDAA